jgi:hypothetical protein
MLIREHGHTQAIHSDSRRCKHNVILQDGQGYVTALVPAASKRPWCQVAMLTSGVPAAPARDGAVVCGWAAVEADVWRCAVCEP